MKIHTYLSSSGKDLIMEYINALTIEEQVDGLAVLAYMEKGEFEKVLSKRWDKKVYEVYFRRNNRIFYAEMIELRKQKGISQTQLARTIGNRQQVISRIEKKENSPSLKMFCCILDSLGYELKIVKKN